MLLKGRVQCFSMQVVVNNCFLLKPEKLGADQRWAKPRERLDSEWSLSAFFFLLMCRNLVLNFKIETKNDTCVKCDFDITALVSQTLKSSESEIRDSAHLWRSSVLSFSRKTQKALTLIPKTDDTEPKVRLLITS